MPPKRILTDDQSQSESPSEHTSDSRSRSHSQPPPSKRRKGQSDILSGCAIYVLDTKLEPQTISNLRSLILNSGATLASTPPDADIIITGIGMKKRLERHLSLQCAKNKAVVKPSWLQDSVKQGKPLPYSDYVAIRELKESTARNWPLSAASTDRSGSSSHTPSTWGAGGSVSPPSKPEVDPSSAYLLPPDKPYEFDRSKLSPNNRFVCYRACPLVCVNQDLCDYLDIIHRSRELEGEDKSALSYARAIGIIKSYPNRITDETRREVKKLPNIGAKIQKMMDEWIDTGKIAEIEKTRKSERFNALRDFASIYGIGPTTARHLYAIGVKNLKELEVYYGVDGDSTPAGWLRVAEDEPGPKAGKGKPSAKEPKQLSESEDGDAWIKVALALRRDFEKKIPREEVERINGIVCAELEKICPGCISTIVGGYRRGKPESNDIDIVFTHPDREKLPGLAPKLVKALHAKGQMTHVIHTTPFRSHDPLRRHHFDSLEKALTVFLSPSDGVHRRLDLIFSPPETYWTAVVGWTGSTLFQRDIRSVAKQKGLKFDSSGITRRSDSKLFYPRSEKEVFDILGLPWIPPEWRNADA